MNAADIHAMTDRLDSLITDSRVPTDRILDLLKVFEGLDTENQAAALAKKRALMTLMHTMQWRSEKNDPGGQPSADVEEMLKALSLELAARGHDTVETTPQLQALRDEFGEKMPGPHSFDEHVAIAQDEILHHKRTYARFLSEVRQVALPGSKVEGRLKSLESTIRKLHDKPHYASAADLQDLTGVRIVVDTTDEVQRTVERVKARWDVITEDDYLTSPKGGYYRAYHVVVRDKDGNGKEIQVLTHNQLKLANWAHDVYKPRTESQERALAHAGSAIRAYVNDLSRYYAALDGNGDDVPKPECPGEVRRTFGCLA